MVSHSSHTNHEFLISYTSCQCYLCDRKFRHLQKSVDNDVTYEGNFPTPKIAVSLFFNVANLLQIKL